MDPTELRQSARGMRMLLSCAFVLACLAAPTNLTAQTAADRESVNRVIAELLAVDGYEIPHHPGSWSMVIAKFAKGDSREIQFPARVGEEYMVVGVAESVGTDVDICVYGPDGGQLDCDTHDAHAAAVFFTARTQGTYRAVMTAASVRGGGTSYAGMIVLRPVDEVQNELVKDGGGNGEYRMGSTTTGGADARLTATDTVAQRLLVREGIELRGTARIVEYGAGVCNVIEASETATEYERKKANHGKPMDVWELEFSVHNGSGKPLDHLIARYQIEAAWPPCTNWSEPSAGKHPALEWGGASGHIQESGPSAVAPGQTLEVTVFMIVFHEDQPRFERWSLDYDLGVLATGPDDSARAGGNAGVQGVARGDDSAVQLDPTAARPPHCPAAFSAEDTCAGKPAGTACWMELANQVQCYVWNPGLVPGATATWTAECTRGFAQGTGTLTWAYDGKEDRWEGLLRDGRRHGNWVMRYANGSFSEGPYVDGNRHGRWIVQQEGGVVAEGRYFDGKTLGDWIYRYPDGREDHGPLVGGERTGDWVLQYADGIVSRGAYVDGTLQGKWVIRGPNGEVEEGPYVDGKREGDWVLRYPDGREDRGPYVDGEQHGNWTLTYDPAARPDNVFREEGPIVNGERSGTWTYFYQGGARGVGPFQGGVLHGTWTYFDASGNEIGKQRFENGRPVGGSENSVPASGVSPSCATRTSINLSNDSLTTARRTRMTTAQARKIARPQRRIHHHVN